MALLFQLLEFFIDFKYYILFNIITTSVIFYQTPQKFQDQVHLTFRDQEK